MIHVHPEVIEELEVNTEERRPGEVSIGICTNEASHFMWITAEQALTFGRRIVAAARQELNL